MSRSNQLAGLITATPTSTLDTINEINTSLNNDANLSTTLTNSINAKAPLASPTFTGDAVFDTDTLKVDSTNNRVGIGTTSPSTKLDFGVTTAGDNIITLRKNSNSVIGIGAGTGYGVKAFAPSDGNSTDLMFETGLISTGDGTTFTQKGLAVTYGGKVGIGTTDPKSRLNISDSGGATTFIVTDPTRNASGEHWYLRNTLGNFYIGQATDSSGAWDSLQARVTFEDGGYVGIGTTNPESSLEVYGGNNTASSITLRNTAPNPDSHWQITPLYDSDTLAFRSANNSYANRMTIQGDGVVNIPGQLKVGVFGAVAPLALLHHASSLTTGTNNLTQINSRTGVIYINSGHASYIPFYARGGGGVAWNITWLDSDNGSWTTSNSFSYTESGSTPNTYTLDMTSGGGMLSIARTGGSREYQVWVLSRVFL